MTDQEILKELTKSELEEYWIDYRNLIRELRAELKEAREGKYFYCDNCELIIPEFEMDMDKNLSER